MTRQERTLVLGVFLLIVGLVQLAAFLAFGRHLLNAVSALGLGIGGALVLVGWCRDR